MSMSAIMNASTCSINRIAIHRGSANVPMPAAPRQKIAPTTRQVNGVSDHGQIAIISGGVRNIVIPVPRAARPTSPTTHRLTGPQGRPARLPKGPDAEDGTFPGLAEALASLS